MATEKVISIKMDVILARQYTFVLVHYSLSRLDCNWNAFTNTHTHRERERDIVNGIHRGAVLWDA